MQTARTRASDRQLQSPAAEAEILDTGWNAAVSGSLLICCNKTSNCACLWRVEHDAVDAIQLIEDLQCHDCHQLWRKLAAEDSSPGVNLGAARGSSSILDVLQLNLHVCS
jgi:hypothetical protein